MLLPNHPFFARPSLLLRFKDRSRKLYCTLLALALLGLLCMLPRVASASTGAQYVALRNKLHYNRFVTYPQVQENPADYAGEVIELRGGVSGKLETSEGLTLMLSVADNCAPAINIPPSEIPLLKEYDMPTLRVLVRIGAGASGNVVPLTVLAVAHDSTVSAIEVEESAQAQAREKEAERRRQQQAQWYVDYARALRKRFFKQAPSRGAYTRPQPPVAPIANAYLSARVQPLFTPYLNFILGRNPRLNVPQAGAITAHLLHFADLYDVDPRLVVAMIIAESDFDPDATSRTGAMGLGQLMPDTARSLGVHNAYDPVQNLAGSISYLRTRLDTFAAKSLPGGAMTFEQVALAMAAYNAGDGAVKKYGGIPPYRETQAYVRRVMNLYQQLRR